MKVSILVACYNKERYIKECIESILNQTYSNLELIVVDDCSKDRSYSIISSFHDERMIKMVNNRRMFCSSVYKRALDQATGEICGIVDGDDLLSKKAVKHIVQKYQEHTDIDWIYTQFHWCDKTLKVKRTGLSRMPSAGKSLAEMALKGKHCYSHWRTFRTKLREKAELFPDGLQVSVDKNLGFTLEELGNGGFFSKKLYYYRYYKENMSLTLSKEQKDTTNNMAKNRIENRKNKSITVYPIFLLQ